ncbi:hypothetical protein GTG23_03820 [Rhodococcus hoagii]|nr:hypothetical protein [Prescottella equi]
MFSSTLGSNYTASNGVWQNSRVNPPLPSRCGLDIAVVLDLSASVGATNLPILKSATDQLVDAFVGTPSRMAVFGFARYSPNQNATTNEIYPNHPELQSVSTQAGADEFKSQYADWGWAAAPTGIRRCTGSPPRASTTTPQSSSPTATPPAGACRGRRSPRPATGRTRISRTSRRRSSRPTS